MKDKLITVQLHKETISQIINALKQLTSIPILQQTKSELMKVLEIDLVELESKVNE